MESRLGEFTEKKKISFNSDDVDRVMGLIILKGSCFPSEIARDLTLEIEQVNAIITGLVRDEMLKKIIPDEIYPQPLIKCRIREMWSIGVKGYEAFCQRSWFILTEKAFWSYVDRHRGEHRQANEAYINTYSNIELLYRTPEEIQKRMLEAQAIFSKNEEEGKHLQSQNQDS
jgi:hypothetical protein